MLKQKYRQRPLHMILHKTAQLSGAIFTRALFQQIPFHSFGYFQLYALGMAALPQLDQIFAGYLGHSLLVQSPKCDYPIQTA